MAHNSTVNSTHDQREQNKEQYRRLLHVVKNNFQRYQDNNKCFDPDTVTNIKFVDLLKYMLTDGLFVYHKRVVDYLLSNLPDIIKERMQCPSISRMMKVKFEELNALVIHLLDSRRSAQQKGAVDLCDLNPTLFLGSTYCNADIIRVYLHEGL